ncbi:MAG: tRNA (adenosine(37)-N6)-dimethylallyltransferase MiaA [Candidatus Woykebacteria bacterium RBG_16_43_9]|uniref:tRNA dimethylallyltransferase n=2 Tax=Candidatus Woykeibacteriota TaxID=1817899 RepID=A0A1G1WIC8_9BACT|nr:MAG: tRNA (adenosine(37)-N6)-dimethylallyltransferase MiaA [Candidatus Woykebacteria bacterium RBG_16_43_9]OGY28195.1 MAG: tRNA (adenosine(37)-N6)-dimethylallyltransferase MiaA [Candidatus Woykebacteria bacterium RBG_19FT_COMBO_43_10]
MKKLLVIVGPTGTGKTDLALELAKKLDGEIVSADSRQIYIGMDVGTGKIPGNAKLRIKSEELKKEKGRWIVDGVPIHLYDIITPVKTFSVAAYQQLAYDRIAEIHKKNKLPILVGGTGLYIRAVVEGLKIPKAAPNKKLRKHLESKPIQSLIRELEQVDPETVEKIDKSNQRRVVRALEVYHQTGEPFSKLQGKFKVGFDALKIGLTSDRGYLYARVDSRIDTWIKTGFIEEVKILLDKDYKETTALKALGYQQISMYLEGKISLEEAIQRTKFGLHNYIRRQLTWFRKETGIFWFDIANPAFKQQIFNKIQSWLT